MGVKHTKYDAQCPYRGYAINSITLFMFNSSSYNTSNQNTSYTCSFSLVWMFETALEQAKNGCGEVWRLVRNIFWYNAKEMCFCCFLIYFEPHLLH